MLIAKRGLFIVCAEAVKSAKLGIGFKYPCESKDTVDRVAVKSYFRVFLGMSNKIFNSQVMINTLEDKIAHVKKGRFRGGILSKRKLL